MRRRWARLAWLLSFTTGLAFIAAAAFIAPAQAGGMTSKTLTVPLYPQQWDWWCWAASDEMIRTYIRPFNSPTQCMIVSATKGMGFCPTDERAGASDAEVRASLGKAGLTYTTNLAALPAASTIKGQIDLGKPLLYVYKSTAQNTGHAVVITGYAYDPTDPAGSTIYWNDPDKPGTKRSSTYSNLASNSAWKAYFTLYGIS